MKRLGGGDALPLYQHTAETWRLQVSGSQPASLAVETIGTGPAFVWSHGLLGSMAQDLEGGVLGWRDLADCCKVIRVDARGHGRSDCAGEPEDYTWQAMAANLWEITDQFVDDDIVLGGASMGSGASLYAALQRPDRVKGLVLVTPPRAWEWRQGKTAGYRVVANLTRYTRAMPFRLLGCLPPGKRNASFRKNAMMVMARDLASVKSDGVVGAMRGASLSDLPGRERLADLDIPTLILAWPDDETHPLAVAQELHQILPRSQLEVASGVADPYCWPRLVREFIGSLD